MNIEYRDSTTYNIEDARLYIQLPTLIKKIGDTYPGHLEWLNNKFIAGLQSGNERGYSFAVSPKWIDFRYGSLYDTVHTKQLVGCSLLKNSPKEKKLCCLFVDPAYRKQGIASKLIEHSFEILGTEKPFLTVAENNLDQLKPLINKFNFELTSVRESIYRKGVKEYYYNEGR